jgi:hypothetical protein
LYLKILILLVSSTTGLRQTVLKYQLEAEYTEEELRQMEEAASAQRREIENNPRQNDTNWCSCSKCTSLPLPSECLCCHEFSLFDGQLEHSVNLGLYIEMFPNKQHALNKRKVKKY